MTKGEGDPAVPGRPSSTSHERGTRQSRVLEQDRLGLLAREPVRRAFARELGREVEYHALIASTQDRARERGPELALVVANEQSAGRGTHGREWLASAGDALLVSFVYPREVPNASVASLAAGVAVARAAGALATLKWPNDVLVGGRKVAGILTHLADVLIVGVGINVGAHPDLPEAGSLGPDVDRLALLERLARELDRSLAEATVLDAWRARSSVLGHEVVVDQGTEPALRGVARALADDGALLVETAYGPLRIVTGQVRVL